MKTELHLHTSRYSLCAVDSPEDAMSKLADTGYRAVFITEHDRVWPDDELARLRDSFSQLRIFPGIEMTVVPGSGNSCHLLVLGTNDPSYLLMSEDPARLMHTARENNHLTVLAHPFRWDGAEDLLEIAVPDAVEHRTCNQQGKSAQKAVDLSAEYDLPLVNAGDVHTVDMINHFWIETMGDIGSASDIRDIVTAGRYRNISF